jgi:hypothetical protein
VDLTVTRDGNVLVDQTIEFTYQDFQPNGPGCGTCSQASASVIVGPGIDDAGSSDDGGTEESPVVDGSRE